jgi:hypothetical protein
MIYICWYLQRVLVVTNYKPTVRRREVKSSKVVLHEKTKLEREDEKERNRQAAPETEFILHIQRPTMLADLAWRILFALAVRYAGTFCKYQQT